MSSGSYEWQLRCDNVSVLIRHDDILKAPPATIRCEIARHFNASMELGKFS
ncbi:hypothetical protein EDF70_10233 [Neorhizobium sp. JUb45]|nr:hypothetical protein EDF70_10233 [Neorhizobium sp. JUb45]